VQVRTKLVFCAQHAKGQHNNSQELRGAEDEQWWPNDSRFNNHHHPCLERSYPVSSKANIRVVVLGPRMCWLVEFESI
jgi:hypothetical protein